MKRKQQSDDDKLSELKQLITEVSKISPNYPTDMIAHYTKILTSTRDPDLHTALLDQFLSLVRYHKSLFIADPKFLNSEKAQAICDVCLKALQESWYHCTYCNDNYDECQDCYGSYRPELVDRHPTGHEIKLYKWGLIIHDDPDAKEIPVQNNVLCFDGGGVRGYTSILMFERYIEGVLEKLKESQEDYKHYLWCYKEWAKNTKFYKTKPDLKVMEKDYLAQYLIQYKFNLVCGTSIGGIISILFALQIPLSYIKELFEKHSHEIFTKEWFFKLGAASYTNQGLKKIYHDTIRRYYPKEDPEKLTFKFLKVPCAVTSYNLYTATVCWFTNRTKESEDIKLLDAVLATSAGPTYFPIHSFKDKANRNYECLDGGIWANDPRLFAFFSQRLFHANEHHMVYNIISFGTGKYIPQKSNNNFWNNGEGTLAWLLRKPNIVDILLEVSCTMVDQIFTSTYSTGLVRNIRMQIILDKQITLDQYRSINTQFQTFNRKMKDDEELKRAMSDAVRVTWMMGSHEPEPVKSENICFYTKPTSEFK